MYVGKRPCAYVYQSRLLDTFGGSFSCNFTKLCARIGNIVINKTFTLQLTIQKLQLQIRDEMIGKRVPVHRVVLNVNNYDKESREHWISIFLLDLGEFLANNPIPFLINNSDEEYYANKMYHGTKILFFRRF